MVADEPGVGCPHAHRAERQRKDTGVRLPHANRSADDHRRDQPSHADCVELAALRRGAAVRHHAEPDAAAAEALECLEKSGGGPKQPVGRVALFDRESGEYSLSNFTSALRVRDPKRLNFAYLHRFLFWQHLAGVTVHGAGGEAVAELV